MKTLSAIILVALLGGCAKFQWPEFKLPDVKPVPYVEQAGE